MEETSAMTNKIEMRALRRPCSHCLKSEGAYDMDRVGCCEGSTLIALDCGVPHSVEDMTSSKMPYLATGSECARESAIAFGFSAG